MPKARKRPKSRQLPDDRFESAGGPPGPLVKHSAADARAEAEWAGSIDLTSLKVPKWLNAMIEKRSSLEEILETVAQRVQKGTTSPRDALVIANEIGRSPDGGALIHKHLTQEFLNELIRNIEDER